LLLISKLYLKILFKIPIKSLKKLSRYIIVVEHDLSVLDYLSDYICVLYGVPGAYGVVTMPFSVREGKKYFFTGLIFYFSCFTKNK